MSRTSLLEPHLLLCLIFLLSADGENYEAQPQLFRKFAMNHSSFAYSALACFKTGISASASFQSVRKSW